MLCACVVGTRPIPGSITGAHSATFEKESCMLTTYVRRLMGVTTVTDAWSSVRAEKSFFGMTVDQ